MKQLWAPWKVVTLTVVLVFVLGLVAGGVMAAVSNIDPEKSGEQVGRALLPVMVLAGIVAWLVQKSRLADKTKR
jgi:prepilin signal peptidase PulO-like enzyme (type II secretory pathway)